MFGMAAAMWSLWHWVCLEDTGCSGRIAAQELLSYLFCPRRVSWSIAMFDLSSRFECEIDTRLHGGRIVLPHRDVTKQVAFHMPSAMLEMRNQTRRIEISRTSAVNTDTLSSLRSNRRKRRGLHDVHCAL